MPAHPLHFVKSACMIENIGNPPPSSEIVHLGRKSWTAYVQPGALGLVLLLFVTPVAWQASPGAGLLVLLATTGFLSYQFLDLRSYRLYYDTRGVWLFSGFFPWQRGAKLVKWRDLSVAAFYPNLFSWVFNSYTVRIGYRFTNSNDLVASHMRGGREAAVIVNRRHFEMVGPNRLS